jgi:rsbT antagonist protein RsbS
MTGSIPVLRVGRNLLVTVQTELDDALVTAFQEDVLQAIERTAAVGLIVDITALVFVDSYVARVLAETARMAWLMGSRTVLVGMRPEVAATLVRMGFAMEGVETGLDIDDGLARLAAPRGGRDGSSSRGS